MKKFEIEPTTKTPSISFDPEGTLVFKGRSIPEDVPGFFEPVLDWVKEYIKQPKSPTTVEIEMEYLNSGTSKFFMKILKEIKSISADNVEVIVNWYYEEGDDDILERGEYYASILDLHLNFVELE